MIFRPNNFPIFQRQFVDDVIVGDGRGRNLAGPWCLQEYDVRVLA